MKDYIQLLSLLLLALMPVSAIADDISGYRYYQTNSSQHGEKSEFIAYIKNDDPCIYIKDIEKNKTSQFCEIQPNTGHGSISLIGDPNIYPFEMHFLAGRFHFFVAAYWAEQKCEISLYQTRKEGYMELSCGLRYPPKKEKPKEEIQKELAQKAKEYEVLIPRSVKSVSFKALKDQGTYRLIQNNSEENPCFTLESYKNALYKGLTSIKHVCSVKYNNDTINLIGSDGNSWFENFTWTDSSLRFDLNKSYGPLKCHLKLPFTEKSDAVCVDQ